MRKIRLDPRTAAVRYKSYVTGFILSILITVAAYIFVVDKLWPVSTLIFIIMGLAVVQLVVQLVFFLHLGRGDRWKLITFLFTLLVVLVIVIGSLWIMYNLNYNMMRFTPEQSELYMKQNEGI